MRLRDVATAYIGGELELEHDTSADASKPGVESDHQIKG